MKRFLAGLCALLVVLTGCGGSDKKSESASTTVTTAETTTSSEATTTTVAAETTTTVAANTDAAAGAAAGHSGKVGDKLITDGFSDRQEKVAVKVVQIIDPADDQLAASKYKTDPNKRFVIVKSEFTNLGPMPYEVGPDLYLVLIDDRGQDERHVIAIVDSCPGYTHDPIAPNATVSGCTIFQLAKATPIVSVQWSPRPDLTEKTLTWAK